MAENLTKVDQLHNLMPAHYNTRNNPNWNALINALGTSDQNVAELVALIKQQFFIKTAAGTYLDNLSANSGVSRPTGVGMQDATFKKYIPVLAYTPKQVKTIIDQLLNIFFAPEITTAFMVSGQPATYALQDGWSLEYTVDGVFDELIYFRAADFADISAATATEVAAAINRQAKYSNAEDFYNNVNKTDLVKVFSNTIGSKGSVEMVGGLADIVLQFNGFITGAGLGADTQWTITKVGDKTTYTWTGMGVDPQLNLLQAGDVLLSQLPGNVGSFPITNVNLSASQFTVIDLFGTPGTYTQTNANQVKFFTPTKNVVYTQISRAITWEVTPGEVVVEMPATPPVVRRELIGSMHLNGADSIVTAYTDPTSITVQDASGFPMTGNFWLQEVDQILSRYVTPLQNTLNETSFNTRLQGTPVKYSYTTRLQLQTTGDTVAGSRDIINLGSTVGLAKGQNVFMAGVPPYALIDSVGVNAVTITHPATATATGVTVQFAGGVLQGIMPPLPDLAVRSEFALTSLVRSGGVVTATTSGTHNYKVGQTVSVYGSTGIVTFTATGTTQIGQTDIINVTPPPVTVGGGELVDDGGVNITTGSRVVSVLGTTVNMDLPATGSSTESINFAENLNGSFVITSVTSNTFTYTLLGTDGTATTPGNSLVENIGMAPTGHIVVITSALPSSFTRIDGSYVWDLIAPFVLSSSSATLVDSIQFGQTIPLLNLSANTIPATGGYVMFDFGLNTQEGPVPYLYAPNNTALVLDPSYIFKHSHPAGSVVNAINNLGPHIMSGQGTEFAPYITNPSDVRVTLEGLIQSVASTGIFIDFLIRYPQQLYSVLPTYTVT